MSGKQSSRWTPGYRMNRLTDVSDVGRQHGGLSCYFYDFSFLMISAQMWMRDAEQTHRVLTHNLHPGPEGT